MSEPPDFFTVPELTTPDVKTLLARVYTHISLGQYEMVRESCQQLLLAYPTNAQACAILGDLATQESNLPDALHWYQQAVQRDPANEEYRRKFDGAIAQTCFQHSEAPDDQATMIWVPGGTFRMGSPDGVGENDEHPAHQVSLSGYWLYKYEVTVAQYRAFCAAIGHKLPPFPSGYSWAGKKTGWYNPSLQQYPIVNVSWNDAKAYANWAGVRLPSEAQWEYAARGVDGPNYPWGGKATKNNRNDGWDETKCANNYNSLDVGKSTWPVGSFPAGASWCGAHDMAGNVWEWCADWYGDYSATAVTNPTGPATGNSRVLRGGSWGYSEYYLRSAYRNNDSPGYWSNNGGFRCVSLSPGP